jgi:hypothetical protein
MKQTLPSLFDQPHSRTTDPDTSHIAGDAARNSGSMGKQAAWVLDMLKTHNGCTYRELAAAMGIDDPNLCSRRLSDLRHKGQVRNGENRICEVAGNMMQTWWLSETFGPASPVVEQSCGKLCAKL